MRGVLQMNMVVRSLMEDITVNKTGSSTNKITGKTKLQKV